MAHREATRRWLVAGFVAVLLLVASVGGVGAQSPEADPPPKAPSTSEANNPLAKFQAFIFHNYYVPALSELDGQNANTFWMRYAQPFGKWLFRASLPVGIVT